MSFTRPCCRHSTLTFPLYDYDLSTPSSLFSSWFIPDTLPFQRSSVIFPSTLSFLSLLSQSYSKLRFIFHCFNAIRDAYIKFFVKQSIRNRRDLDFGSLSNDPTWYFHQPSPFRPFPNHIHRFNARGRVHKIFRETKYSKSKRSAFWFAFQRSSMIFPTLSFSFLFRSYFELGRFIVLTQRDAYIKFFVKQSIRNRRDLDFDSPSNDPPWYFFSFSSLSLIFQASTIHRFNARGRVHKIFRETKNSKSKRSAF